MALFFSVFLTILFIVDLWQPRVGILTTLYILLWVFWTPCKFYCGYFEYPVHSTVGILNTLQILLSVFWLS